MRDSLLNSGVHGESAVRQESLEPLPWRKRIVNPITLVLYVIVINVILTTHLSPAFIVLTLSVVAVALAVAAPARLTITWLLFVAVCALCHWALPIASQSSITVLSSFVALWMMRFAGMFAAFVTAGCALDVHQLGATLTQCRAPRWLYVPVMVVVRFFPMALRDLRAIVDAMSLRGLKPGPWGALRHPLRTGQYVLIPFLAAAARVADELAAAAIIKGLGSSRERTTVVRVRFQLGDAIVIAALAALIIAYLVGAR